jgi:hypothetical protein
MLAYEKEFNLKASYMFAGVTGSCGGKNRIVIINKTHITAI